MKNTNGIKLIWVVVIAVVALIAGYLISSAVGGQAASLRLTSISKNATLKGSDVPSPNATIGVFWVSGVCKTYRWNDTSASWDYLGDNNLGEARCRNFPPAPTSKDLSSMLAPAGGAAAVKTGDTVYVPGMWKIAWDAVNGCTLYKWIGGANGSWHSEGGVSGVTKENCHEFPMAATASTKTR